MPFLATTAKGIGTLSSFAGRQASASGGSSLNASVGVQNLSSSVTQTSMRSIHIPTAGRATHHPTPHSPRPFSSSPASYANRALHSARQALTGFLEHLTTPGLSHAGPSRPLHTAFNATRPQSIQTRSSLQVRNAINRTFYARGVPTGPKSVFDVGLGPARNFSSSRQAFQQITQNVPVYARALYEADFDSKKRRAAAKVDMRRMREKGKGPARSAEKLKAQQNFHHAASLVEQTEDIDEFFSAPVTDSAVTSYLRIPLAPTPTSRVPLSSTDSPMSARGLFSLSELSGMHHSYSTHSLRVSSIFMRLDAARVWDTGDVKVDAFGDPSGLCTILQVEFRGWTAKRVRDVIGEAGKDWCEIEEVLPPDRIAVDPSESLVLPKLDFSSSFLASTETPAHPTNFSFPPSPTLSSCDELSMAISISPSFSDLEDDGAESDMEDISDHMVGLEPANSSPRPLSPVSSSSGSWIGFSSDFIQQTNVTL